MTFFQLDRCTTTCLSDLVRLKAGTHIETIRFTVVPEMTEPMVLGVPWCKNWSPSVN